MDFTHTRIAANGVSLHCAQAGPEDGTLVLLLHGFPDFWYTWKQQLSFLAGQGYRVIAPDQRGYNLSDKPDALRLYNIDELARDVTGLMDALGHSKAILVGHDFGGSVAWRVAHLYPDRVDRLVALNVPHSSVLKRALRTNLRQKLRSWYIFALQIPAAPEWLLKAFDYRLLARVRSRGCPLSPEDLAHYVAAWSQPGALHGMIQWYRALLQTQPKRMHSPMIEPPVLLLWGRRDPYLAYELAPASLELCRNARLITIDEASHWVQHDAADAVNRHVLEFIRS